MFHLKMDGKKIWIMGAIVAAALFAAGRAGAEQPFIPGVFDDAKAIQGTWYTLETDAHGAFQPLGLSLKEDGQFLLEVADAHGTVVERVSGRYTYATGVLTLLVEAKVYAAMNVQFDDDALNLKTAAGKMSHWTKGPA